MFTGKLTNKPCFLCGKTGDTLDVKLKDKTFAGVICIADLVKILRRKGDEPQKPEVTK